MQAEKRLQKIDKRIRECRGCNLAKARLNTVPGEGNPHASIVIVGEGVGRDNDLQGRPFVGMSGRILNSILEDIGLKREDLYLTNVLKCRMPNNAVPTRYHIDMCLGYLKEQLKP